MTIEPIEVVGLTEEQCEEINLSMRDLVRAAAEPAQFASDVKAAYDRYIADGATADRSDLARHAIAEVKDLRTKDPVAFRDLLIERARSENEGSLH